MKVIFETHAKTLDDEAGLASGWNDVTLSERGEKDARLLGIRYEDVEINAIFTSDLQRAYRTAQIAFPDVDPTYLFLDWRLRGCNYGDMVLGSKAQVDAERNNRITRRFPHGESYGQVIERVGSFVGDLKQSSFDTVLVIGSLGTHFGLDHCILGKPVEECVATKFTQQPGWEYEL